LVQANDGICTEQPVRRDEAITARLFRDHDQRHIHPTLFLWHGKSTNGFSLDGLPVSCWFRRATETFMEQPLGVLNGIPDSVSDRHRRTFTLHYPSMAMSCRGPGAGRDAPYGATLTVAPATTVSGITTNGTLTRLFVGLNINTNALPLTALIRSWSVKPVDGNLYGTTASRRGSNNGTVFRITTNAL